MDEMELCNEHRLVKTHLVMISPLSSSVCCESEGSETDVSGSATHNRRCRCRLPLPCSSNLNQEPAMGPKTLALPLTNLKERAGEGCNVCGYCGSLFCLLCKVLQNEVAVKPVKVRTTMSPDPLTFAVVPLYSAANDAWSRPDA